MKKMETCPEKDAAVVRVLERMRSTGMDGASIARLSRVSERAVQVILAEKAVPRWATIDKINRALNRWEASK